MLTHSLSDLFELTPLRVLTPAARGLVAAHMVEASFRAGQREILAPGVWILVQGSARVSVPHRSDALDPGAVLGSETLWSRAPQRREVEAVTPCRWLQLAPESFQALSAADAGAGLELLLLLLRAEPFSEQPQSGVPRLHTRPGSVVLRLRDRELVVPTGTTFHELLPEVH